MLLDLRTVAHRLQTDQPTVLALVEAGDMPAPLVIAGRLVRWPEELLADWARKGCPKCEPPAQAEFMDARCLQVAEDQERDYRRGLLERPEDKTRRRAADEEAARLQDELDQREMDEDWEDFQKTRKQGQTNER